MNEAIFTLIGVALGGIISYLTAARTTRRSLVAQEARERSREFQNAMMNAVAFTIDPESLSRRERALVLPSIGFYMENDNPLHLQFYSALTVVAKNQGKPGGLSGEAVALPMEIGKKIIKELDKRRDDAMRDPWETW